MSFLQIWIILAAIISSVVLKFLLVTDILYFDDGLIPKFDKQEMLEASNISTTSKICRKVIYQDGLPFDAEDPIFYSDNIIIFASGDLNKMFDEGKRHKSIGSNIYIYDVAKNEVFPVRYRDFDPSTGFVPHGTYYSKETERIYIINHFGSPAHTTVEIFNVVTQSNSEYPILFRLGALKGNFQFGTVNDLVESGNNEVYLTQWLPKPLPLKGIKGEMSFGEIFYEFLRPFKYLFEVFYESGLIYCRFDLNNLDINQFCTRVEGNIKFSMSNGIAINKKSSLEHNILYVSDVFKKELKVFQVPKMIHTKDKTLVSKEVKYLTNFPVIDSIDNVNYDESRNLLVAGGMPSMFAHFKFNKFPENTIIPGSMLLIDVETGQNQRILYHSGSRLNALATCIYSRQDDQAKAVCGSPFGYGLLVCNLD